MAFQTDIEQFVWCVITSDFVKLDLCKHCDLCESYDTDYVYCGYMPK